MEGYLAQVIMFAGDFAPRFWAFCFGQTMSIASNTALFSLLGTTYGGNGATTFNLPDFRGRFPRGVGTGPGLSPVSLGAINGAEIVTLVTGNLPAHIHPITGNVTIQAAGDGNLSTDPANRYLGPGNFYAAAADLQSLAPATHNLATQAVGSNIPVGILPPYIGINFVICLQGIFPSRN